MGNFANIGYLFQRDYYKGLTSAHLTDKGLQVRFFQAKNNNIILNSKQDLQRGESPIGGQLESIELQTVYPGLITGIGMIHQTGMQGEAKLGMAFDYTTGLPVIPGSSVKGLLRSMFPILSIPELTADEVDELVELIFNGQTKDKKYLPMYERDVFFDAEIEGDHTSKGFLDFDYITPHPDEFKDPTPVKFLKILPEVTFVFRFRLSDSTLLSGTKVTAATKKALFEEILKTVGIGAKTNVGYGQLRNKQEGQPAAVAEQEAPAAAVAEQEVPAVDAAAEPQTSQAQANAEVVPPIARVELKDEEATLPLVKLPGSPLKVKLNGQNYDLKFNNEADRKKIKKNTQNVKVTLRKKNGKVVSVYFESAL